MYSHLSKKEKKKKLALARKRAITWSAQQQTLNKLRNTTSHITKLAQSTTTTKPQSKQGTFLQPPETSENSFYTPIFLSDDKTRTIQAIQQTLLDLQEQKEAIDTTIKVLQSRLHFLQNSKTP